MAEKAQQDPHYPYYLTLVTAPNLFQSFSLGICLKFNN